MSAMVDKGPSNALAKLNSQVGSSRHAQGDLFARSGSSSQGSGFRTSRPPPPQLDRASDGPQQQQQHTPFTAYQQHQQQHLPASQQAHTSPAPQQSGQWAADFHATPAAASSSKVQPGSSYQPQAHAQPAQTHGFRQPQFAPPMYRPFVPLAAPPQASAVPSPSSAPTYAAPTPELASSSIAQTASLLVSSANDRALDASTAEKLRSSDFMALMRDFADGRKDVLGEEVVDARVRQGWANSREGDEGWAQDFSTGGTSVDKGKGRDLAGAIRDLSLGRSSPSRSVHFPPDVSPYTILSDADLRAATAIPSSSMRWEEDMNDDQVQEAFLYYNGPPRQQRHAGRNGQTANDGALADGLEEQARATASYEFQKSNPWLDERFARVQRESADDDGQGVLQQEAKVLADPGAAQGWLDLGIKQQENEREQEAIIALEKCISIDSSLSQAYLALAISHTNNSDPTSTFRALESWVENQSQAPAGPYHGVLQKWELQTGIGSVAREGLSTKARGDWLSGALIEMVKAGMDQGRSVDGDLQVALGVLFNTSGAFEQAQDCFRTALAVKPDDYQLYNRLGATLANGGKAAEAYDLYWHALELRPGFVRARFNLGISCINLQRYEEAAEHVLTALRLQLNDSASGGGKPSVGSATLWDTLRNACAYMQRHDLVGLCQARNLAGFDGIDFAEGGSWDGRAA